MRNATQGPACGAGTGVLDGVVAALGLLRSLAFESLDATRDIDQLRTLWLQLDSADRRDPFVAARAATLAARFGAHEDGRAWLRPFWERAAELGPDERAVIADALVDNMDGLSADWLPRLEAVATAFPRESAVAHAVGSALAQLQLWGKARRLLVAAAGDEGLSAAARRKAWMRLAQIAADEGNDEEVRRCEKKAANL